MIVNRQVIHHSNRGFIKAASAKIPASRMGRDDRRSFFPSDRGLVRLWRVMVLVLLALSTPEPEAGASTCDPWIAQIISIENIVETRVTGEDRWRPVVPKETFCFGDQIRVQANSRAEIALQDHIVRLGAHTTLDITRKEGSLWLNLMEGLANFFSRAPVNVTTPFVNASVEGTEFLIQVGPAEATIAVFEGKVTAANNLGQISLKGGESAVARLSAPPVIQVIARPRDAVQWALYYPAVLQFEPRDFEGHSLESWQGRVARSIEFYKAGDLAKAFQALEEIGGTISDSRFYAYRASLRLSVGRVKEAREDIDQALSQNSSDGDAYALKAVISVVQNDQEEAREAAHQAVIASPDSPGPHLAASLVWQADFQLEKARESVKRAVEIAPDRPLGWARLAEMHLMFGDLGDALEAARKAVEIDPAVAHTQTVLGFAYLSLIDLAAAQMAFEKAMMLDQAAPLPRLGLGLLKIRKGSLKEGRREIEAAAMLDPGNALIRSYLGKAYFDEKRDERASAQYELAKGLDERDPTPYLYSAILHQTENRPVIALREILKSIELNHSRAVYRSRLLLDEDLAVRGTSLGRVYQDLGFQHLALVEGWKSVALAPEDYSGHRLLADSYADLPRHQIARASELLQSQLLQEINTAPIQPQLAETNLAILEGIGPSEISFNEFNPLFVRDRLVVQVNGVIGNHSTLGNDLILSAIHGPLSFSVGQFHYESDGFRENNDLRHDIYNLFAQAAVTPHLNLQAEIRRRETERGFLALNFNPADFSSGDRATLTQSSIRVGAHYTPTVGSDLIMSLIHYDRRGNDKHVFGIPDSDMTLTRIDRPKNEGYQAEAQVIVTKVNFNLTSGIANYDINNRSDVVIDELEFERPDFEQKSMTAYMYYHLFAPATTVWTLGGSYQIYKERDLNIAKFNPKFGLQWDINRWLHFRAAYMRTIKQGLVVEQTIEPTQVAGINQFWDDVNGSLVNRRGVGLDILLTKKLRAGVEGIRHDLEIPRFGENADFVENAGSFEPKILFTPVEIKHRREEDYQAYLYWTPNVDWAVSAEYSLVKVSNHASNPEKLNTVKIPVSIGYFSATGGFSKVETTYVRQRLHPEPISDFILLDIAAGFRFPNRSGIATLEVRNVFDRKFLYQDSNFLRSEPIFPEFIPDRTILGRILIYF